MSLRIALTAMILVAPFAKFTVRHPHKSAAIPKLISVTQITRDGIGKTSLLSDGKNLYVTEWPSTGHVVAKFSLSDSNRSLVTSNFSELKALDVAPDKNSLLVTPVRAGAAENELWTLPIDAGIPQKLGSLLGHDASWSADGRQLAFVKGSTLSIAGGDGLATYIRRRVRFSACDSLLTAVAFDSALEIQHRTQPRFGRSGRTARTRIPSWATGSTLRQPVAGVGALTAATTFFR